MEASSIPVSLGEFGCVLRVWQKATTGAFFHAHQFAGPFPVFDVPAVGFAVGFPQMIGTLADALLALGVDCKRITGW